MSRRALVGVLIVVFGWAGVAGAQNVGASLQGTVADSSGAPVPGVTVVVRSLATGGAREFVTDAEGRYHVPLLPPGEYQIRAALAGFQTGRITSTVTTSRQIQLGAKLTF